MPEVCCCGEVERATGIIRQFAGCFRDYRNADLIEHTVEELAALRRLGLRGTESAKAQCDTIRVKLLKIGAQIRVTVRKVWLSLAESYPYQHVFRQAHYHLFVGCARFPYAADPCLDGRCVHKTDPPPPLVCPLPAKEPSKATFCLRSRPDSPQDRP